MATDESESSDDDEDSSDDDDEGKKSDEERKGMTRSKPQFLGASRFKSLSPQNSLESRPHTKSRHAPPLGLRSGTDAGAGASRNGLLTTGAACQSLLPVFPSKLVV